MFSHKGTAAVAVLDWSDLPQPGARLPGEEVYSYDLVLAADPLYSPTHPRWLVDAIERYLKRDDSARFMVELPLRQAYQPQVEEFKDRMRDSGLRVVVDGEGTGFDDWDDGRAEVRTYWGVWMWASAS